MDFSLGFLVGIGLCFAVWRWQLRHERRVEEAYRLFVKFHAVCNEGNEDEAEEAHSRYLRYYVDHGLNAAAFEPGFKDRIEQTCKDAKAIGNQRT